MNLRNMLRQILFPILLGITICNCSKAATETDHSSESKIQESRVFLEAQPFAVSPLLSQERTPVRSLLGDRTYFNIKTGYADGFVRNYAPIVKEDSSPLIWDEKTADLFISAFNVRLPRQEREKAASTEVQVVKKESPEIQAVLFREASLYVGEDVTKENSSSFLKYLGEGVFYFVFGILDPKDPARILHVIKIRKEMNTAESLAWIKRDILAAHLMTELSAHAFFEKIGPLGEVKKEPLLEVVAVSFSKHSEGRFAIHQKFINSIPLIQLLKATNDHDSDGYMVIRRHRSPEITATADSHAQSFGFDSNIDLYRHIMALYDFYISTHALVIQYIASNGGKNLYHPVDANGASGFDCNLPNIYWDPTSKRFQIIDL